MQIRAPPAARVEGSKGVEQERLPETLAPIGTAHAQKDDVATGGIFARLAVRADIPGEVFPVPGEEPSPGSYSGPSTWSWRKAS
jgi:hypothetical protein